MNALKKGDKVVFTEGIGPLKGVVFEVNKCIPKNNGETSVRIRLCDRQVIGVHDPKHLRNATDEEIERQSIDFLFKTDSDIDQMPKKLFESMMYAVVMDLIF